MLQDGRRRLASDQAAPAAPEARSLGRTIRGAPDWELAMTFKITFAAAAALSAMLASVHGAAAAAADGQAAITRGQRIAQRNCSQCHSIGPTGESSNAKAPPFRTLYKRYPGGALEEAFGNGLLTRHPAMPEIRLLPGEIADVTAYVKSLQNDREARAGGVRAVALAHP
jgi:mono/diheme cytochrome c family protein